MVFSSLFFLFAFLVLCYGVYLLAPTIKAQNTVLLVFSLIFYAWGGPPLVLLLCLMTLICFFMTKTQAEPSMVPRNGMNSP